MDPLALNIETEANQEVIDKLPPITDDDITDKRITKRETKDAKKREMEADRISKMALSPLTGKLLCITVAKPEPPGDMKVRTLTTLDNSEPELITWTWNTIKNPLYRIVTFNGAGFDLNFILMRTILLSLDVPNIPKFELSKYKLTSTDTGNHCDMYHVLQPFAATNAKLSTFAKFILGQDWPYAHVDQSALGQLIKTEPDTVRGLCEWNTIMTLKLYQKVQGFI